MGLTADEKDVTIAKLAISLTVAGGRCDDLETQNASLRERIEQLEQELEALKDGVISG